MIQGCKRAVFFGCHLDDEIVCAGTLHRLARSGCEVSVVAFVTAATKDDRAGTEKSIPVVLPEWNRSLDSIGVGDGLRGRTFVGITPSGDIHARRQEVCQLVYDWCECFKPEIAFTLSPDDENTAHAVVGVECERVMRGRVPVVLRCHMPWNFGIGRASLHVALDKSDLVAKRASINAYQSQKFRYDYEGLLMAQTVVLGKSVKVDAAEAFEVVRAVV